MAKSKKPKFKIEPDKINLVRAEWITRNPATQVREAGNNVEHVESLTLAIKREKDGETPKAVPPIVCFWDAAAEELILSAGWHRDAGHQAAGLHEYEAMVFEGTLEDAIAYAVTANNGSGLPETRLDKTRKSRMALALPRFAGMSNRKLAVLLGVSHETVGAARRDLGLLADSASTTRTTTRKVGDKEVTVTYEPKKFGGAAHKPKPAPKQEPEAEPTPPPAAAEAAPVAEDKPEIVAGPEPRKGKTLPKELPVTDALGREVPAYLRDAFEVRTFGLSVIQRLGALKTEIAGWSALPGGSRVATVPFGPDLTTVQNDVRAAVPHCVCPRCDGDGQAGDCGTCGGEGWVTVGTFGRLEHKLQEHAKSFKAQPGDAFEPEGGAG